MEAKPLLTHLDELLLRTRRIFIWAFIGCTFTYFYTTELLDFLWAPSSDVLVMSKNLVFTKPFEKIWVLIRLSFISGVILMSPFIGYEIIAFIKPALTEKERRRSQTLLFSITVSGILGVIVGYKYILPLIIKAVLRFGGDNIMALFTVSSYVNTALGILLLSGLFFEIPVIMLHLTSWGWVGPKTWSKGRKIALVINSIVSAVLSPPDPMSMIIMMIPLQILYEAGIQLSRMADYRREKEHSAT